MNRLGILAGLACAVNCLGQWQLGGLIGYGVYRNGSIIAPSGSATAGIKNRFVAGAMVGEDRYEHLSGEFRYTYHDGDPFISAGGQDVRIQGQSHSFEYDLLVHLNPRESRLRPYLEAGVGAKQFVVAGPAPRAQILGSFGTLTTQDQVRLLVTAGLGVQYKLQKHVIMRVDFRDYITQFPSRLIAPAPFNTARGILNQFTPSFGLCYAF